MSASAHLRYPIERRVSVVEVIPYETLRWTERPDVYVRRSLDAALFDARPLDESTSGPVAVLDVDVLAFEEVARAGIRVGRVELRYELRGPSVVVAHGEVAIEHAATAPSIDAVVAAIGEAMDAATATVADRVVAATCAP